MSKVDIAVHCAHDKVVPISGLKPNPANPNKHPPEQIRLLAKIIRAQGWRNPIVVSNRSGLITKGHGRLDAARQLGVVVAPVDYQDYASEKEELADMIADNRIAELAEADRSMLRDLAEQLDDGAFDMELTGFDPAALEELMTAAPPESDVDAEPQIDKADELRKKWKVERGQIWELGAHRLMCGDSTLKENVDALVNGERAELCFTSPPYADQREYKGAKLSIDHLYKFLSAASNYVGIWAINLGLSRKDGEVNTYWDEYIREANRLGLKLLSWNVWDKTECGSIGNQSAMFGISHEWIFVFGETPKTLFKTLRNKSAGELANHTGHRQADGSIKPANGAVVREFSQLKTVLTLPAQKARDDINHPARFPVSLPSAYINAIARKASIVYEPFSGSGTTIIACEQLGRKCRAMEIDPGYVAVAIQRWSDATGKTPRLAK